MGGLKELLNKAGIAFYTFAYRLLSKRKERKPSSDILILAPNAIGDAILFLDAIREINDFYPSNNIVLICKESMKPIYEMSELKGKIRVETIASKTHNWEWVSLRDYCSTVRKFDDRRYVVVVVVVGDTGWNYWFPGCLCAEQKWSCSYKYSLGRMRKFAVEHFYDNIIYLENDAFLGKAYESLLHEWGDMQYVAKPPVLFLEDGGEKRKREYILISPFASMPTRNLTVEQVLDIVNYILDNSSMDIIFSGNKEEQASCEKIVNSIGSPRVFNYVGKTTLIELFHLINGAFCVVGADSGQTHIAAALHTRSVVLKGRWNGGNFLPYPYENNEPYNPICIYPLNDYSCENCLWEGGIKKIKTRNKTCAERLSRGQCFLCLSEIGKAEIERGLREVLS